jgi:hypothetical protein
MRAERTQTLEDFAVAPKRQELIMDMQALIGVSEDPPVLAAHRCCRRRAHDDQGHRK